MRYLSSTRHLVGAALALLGLGAHFAGLLGTWWLPIVLGLYVLGVLVTPARTRADVLTAQQARADDLGADLTRFVNSLRGQVPPALLERTQHIARSCRRSSRASRSPTAHREAETAKAHRG